MLCQSGLRLGCLCPEKCSLLLRLNLLGHAFLPTRLSHNALVSEKLLLPGEKVIFVNVDYSHELVLLHLAARGAAVELSNPAVNG